MRRFALLLLTTGCAHEHTLWLAGDVQLGHGGPERLAALPRGAVLNLEGPVVERLGDTTVERVANGPQTTGALREAGVAAVGIANNHALDEGPKGLTHTRVRLEAAGVPVASGAQAAHLMLGALRVAVTAHDLTAGVPPMLRAELTAARSTSDVLVATFHVTAPPSPAVVPELEEAVRLAVNAGALVIAAHGTHALARVERRGRAIIAWGLGNVVFECACTDEREGILLGVTFDAHGEVSRATVLPLDAGLQGAPLRLADNPTLTFELLEAVGSSPLQRQGERASF